MTEELPDKLPVRPWPLCAGSSELDTNRFAVECNGLDSKDSRRKDVYQQYRKAISEVEIGLMD